MEWPRGSGQAMRPNVAEVRETLDAAAIPKHNTELNYRTSVTTWWQDLGTTAQLLVASSLLATPIVMSTELIAPLHWLVASWTFQIALLLLGVVLVRFVFSGTTPKLLAWAAFLGVCSFLAALLSPFREAGSAYLVLFTAAIAFAFVLSYFIAKQAAFWMTAHPRVPRERMRAWQDRWPPLGLHYADPEIPEASGSAIGFGLLLAAWVVGFVVQRIALQTPLKPEAGALAILAFSLAILGGWQLFNLSGNLPRAPFYGALMATFNALRTFACYNRHGIQAAGVFQFPTARLRSATARDFLLFSSMMAFVIAIVGIGLKPGQVLPETVETVVVPQEPPPELTLEPYQVDYLESLPNFERQIYVNKLRQEQLDEWRARQDGETAKQREEALRAAKPFVGQLLSTFLACVVGPPVLLFLTLFVTWGHLLYLYYESLEAPDAHAQSADSVWEVSVDRIAKSGEALEREHLLLGASTLHDYPVLLHRDLLKNHAHIVGDTGARKTALAIAPLAAQIIATKDTKLQASVVLIDLKGEEWLFHSMRDEAERNGKRFRWFTIVPNAASYIFNPFTQSYWPQLSVEQCTQLILQALSLDYGLGYGKGFFSAMNETVLLQLLRSDHRINSFRDLYTLIDDPVAYKSAGGNLKDWRDARHLAALVNRLSAAHALNLMQEDVADKPEAWEQAIDMASLFEEPQVLYFHLPSPLEPVGAPAIAKLALYSLFTAASHRVGPRKQVFVFIDEFQQIICDSVKLILEQARSRGLSLTLAHQTAGQLDRNGSDLAETVESCCAFKQVLKASDTKSAKRLAEGSGDALYHMGSTSYRMPDTLWGQEPFEEGFEIKEAIGPRLEKNTIIEVSADPMTSFVRFTEGTGYTQFSGYWTSIVSQFHQTSRQFKNRSERAWPTESAETVTASPSSSAARCQQRSRRHRRKLCQSLSKRRIRRPLT